jgi:hypothetical protein
MVEAVEPFKMHSISMSYLYEVFEHLQLLWMCIWLHTHTVTTTDVSPDLGELAESLGDASVQPYHYAIVEAVEPFKLHITSMSYLRLFNLKRTLLHLAGTKTQAGQTGRSRGLLMNIFAAIEFK